MTMREVPIVSDGDATDAVVVACRAWGRVAAKLNVATLLLVRPRRVGKWCVYGAILSPRGAWLVEIVAKLARYVP